MFGNFTEWSDVKSQFAILSFWQVCRSGQQLLLSGYSLDLHIMDECIEHGSSTVIECIALGIERAASICQARGIRMPSCLVLLGDNTVKELKNQILFKYACNLVGRRKFRIVTFQFLRKSHTHDKIDQLWGIVARRISNEPKLLDPSSTINVIESELKRPGVRQWVGTTTHLNVGKLDATRDWKVQWDPQGSKLEGGLLEDSTANHSFIFLCRGGLCLTKKQYRRCWFLNVQLHKQHQLSKHLCTCFHMSISQTELEAGGNVTPWQTSLKCYATT